MFHLHVSPFVSILVKIIRTPSTTLQLSIFEQKKVMSMRAKFLKDALIKNYNNPKSAWILFQETLFQQNIAKITLEELKRSLPLITPTLIKAQMFSEIETLQSQLLEIDCVKTDSVVFSVVKTLAKSGKSDKALSYFKNIRSQFPENTPSVIIYNILIEYFLKVKSNLAVNWLSQDMTLAGVKPDTYNYNLFIGVSCNLGRIEEARERFDSMRKDGCEPNEYTFSILASGYCNNGFTVRGLELFGMMKKMGINPDIVMYNTLIGGFSREDKADEEIGWLIDGMKREGITPNVVTYNTQISALCKYGKVAEAEKLVSEMKGKGLLLNKATLNSIASFTGQKKGGAASRAYVDKLPKEANAKILQKITEMAPGIKTFGGLFPLGDSYLVAGTDGVGDKLKFAFETGIHETIGMDLVAMNVNDIITYGAKPVIFLDYFATSYLDVGLAVKVIKGIVDSCNESDCILIGGKTSEIAEFYAHGVYDLSGFALGIVKQDAVIDGTTIEKGDVLIGLPSSGLHLSGFSLVRRVLELTGHSLKDDLPGYPCSTLGGWLMEPTAIYVKQVLDIISKGGVKGVVHIKDGGLTGSLDGVFPKGLGAKIVTDSWMVPDIFKWIQEAGQIEDEEMRRTFNMGIGMVLIVNKKAASGAVKKVKGKATAYRIGEVVRKEGVTYK